MAGVGGKEEKSKEKEKGSYGRTISAVPMAGKFSDRRNVKGSAEWTMRNWKDGQNVSTHASRIIQPAESVDRSYCKRGFYPFTSTNALLGPAFNACLDAHADVDPALLRYYRLPVQLHDHMSVGTADITRPTRTLVGHRPSPIIIPTSHVQSPHLPLHRRFPATSPISTGSSLSCLALPTPVKRTITGKMQEDDVVVMEGVVVTGSASTGTWPRSSSAGAGSSLSPSSLSLTSVLFKTEMCRPWEETGSCRYGDRCQFAHGKEELRPVPPRNKPEVNRPRVGAQGLSTPREMVASEEEKKIMSQTEEFEAMDAVIDPNADVACNKRRLPVFVALTESTDP